MILNFPLASLTTTHCCVDVCPEQNCVLLYDAKIFLLSSRGQLRASILNERFKLFLYFRLICPGCLIQSQSPLTPSAKSPASDLISARLSIPSPLAPFPDYL